MNNFKAQAVLGMPNFGGISIMLNKECDGVRYKWYDKKPSRWCKIYYTQNGSPYFMIRNVRYHLNEFIIHI